MTRRVPALVLTVVAFAAIVITARDTPATVAPVFASVRAEWMPSAPPAGGLTQTWFCPGVPATGEEGVGGELVVANAGSTQISGIGDVAERRAGHGVTQDLAVAPHDRTVVDLDAQLSGQIVSAVVEVDGGGAIVEQRAFDPAGTRRVAVRQLDVRHLVPGRRLHGRREPEPDRADQPVRRRRDRRRRLRHGRRVTHTVAVPGLPDRGSQREDHRSRGGGRGRPR